MAKWLRPGGYLLAIVGFERWTGIEEYMGAPMFWDHADTQTYLAWLEEAGMHLHWHRVIPEGTSQPHPRSCPSKVSTVGYTRVATPLDGIVWS